VVPGNHDLPLWRFWRRLLQPLRHYRQLIHPVDQPYWQNDEFAIFGLNTASRWTWKSGVLSRRQIAQMQRFFGTNDAQVRLVVSHHPLLSELNEGKKHIFKLGSLRAVLAENAIDILLSGHLHQSKIADVEVARLDSSHTCISIQAGTAISERYRTEANAYNILNIESAGLGVAVRGYNHVKFDQKYRIEFTKKNRVWQMKNKQIAG
jgi:3',5'-cyclic AMP phosphodiesterase CpdA